MNKRSVGTTQRQVIKIVLTEALILGVVGSVVGVGFGLLLARGLVIGMGNFAGAIVGAFAFEYLLHVFKDITKHWQLLMGGFIVLVVVAAPRGLLGMLGQRRAAKAQEDPHHG